MSRNGSVPGTDAVFSDPRLAGLYDPLDADRGDLDAYVSLAEDVGARSVLDIGCGTGVLALRLVAAGYRVVGVDPALASLQVARGKTGAAAVTWIHGDAPMLPPLQVHLAVMTGNVAQVFLTDAAWSDTLSSVHASLRPGGSLVFETRDAAARGWEAWTRERSWSCVDVEGVGPVQSWHELIDVWDGYVSFRWNVLVEVTGERLLSESTLRFRSRDEVELSLHAAGFELDQVLDAPDRPGLELVFQARRPG